MKGNVHKNYRIASNLIFLILGLVILYSFLPGIDLMAGMQVIKLISLAFFLGLGLLVRWGLAWVKYLVLVLGVVDALGVPGKLIEISLNPLSGLVNLTMTALLFASVIFLFTIPKKSRQEIIENANNNQNAF